MWLLDTWTLLTQKKEVEGWPKLISFMWRHFFFNVTLTRHNNIYIYTIMGHLYMM